MWRYALLQANPKPLKPRLKVFVPALESGAWGCRHPSITGSMLDLVPKAHNTQTLRVTNIQNLPSQSVPQPTTMKANPLAGRWTPGTLTNQITCFGLQDQPIRNSEAPPHHHDCHRGCRTRYGGCGRGRCWRRRCCRAVVVAVAVAVTVPAAVAAALAPAAAAAAGVVVVVVVAAAAAGVLLVSSNIYNCNHVP